MSILFWKVFEHPISSRHRCNYTSNLGVLKLWIHHHRPVRHAPPPQPILISNYTFNLNVFYICTSIFVISEYYVSIQIHQCLYNLDLVHCLLIMEYIDYKILNKIFSRWKRLLGYVFESATFKLDGNIDPPIVCVSWDIITHETSIFETSHEKF